ncbi:GtrA family protein [Alkalicaulis satelles]|uniref:GtrA family protein n=1 Tax=Alkalicaulis satelles TaxID=2609175 RepID=A0A5M6ZP83_9PROT|nr:GtrA family protein [Alkalicaulis satelles]KAA5805384.1 GtrA family protein [Alkalicaulis satelles]
MIRTGVFQLMRFGVVGVAATLVYAGLVAVFFAMEMAPFAANALGFAIAFLVSAAGHVMWTFAVKSGRIAATARFFVVALGGFAVSNAVLGGWLAASGPGGAAAALALAVIAVPAATFLASRYWAFAASSS